MSYDLKKDIYDLPLINYLQLEIETNIQSFLFFYNM